MRAGERLALFTKRHLLWLLIASYVLATLWPGPGLLLREWHWSLSEQPYAPLSLPLLLLTLMLFVAALLTDVSQIRATLRQPLILCASLVLVWLGPVLLVVAAGYLVPSSIGGVDATGLVVGLALVATMPVANSSVGWTQSADGNLALSLALVVLSISLSPLLTPSLLGLLGESLAPPEQAYCEVLVNRFSGWFFILWVVLPTVAGFACRWLVTPRRVQQAANSLSLASAAALLALNYINSALALPKIDDTPLSLVATMLTLATALSAVGLCLGWLVARWMPTGDQTRTSMMFGLSMKHTGLALLLAGSVLADQPLAILVIVLATLTQHLLAGIVQWFTESRKD
jgi:BASS family bile acid:Na+ symporter